MVEIGPYPILWHIMRHYSHYGLNDFIICLGYKGYVIKEYFANYVLHRSESERGCGHESKYQSATRTKADQSAHHGHDG